MNPYNNWFYNPAVFNQRSYEEYVAEMQRRQAYEQNQTLEVLKVSKAFDDLLTELPKIDAAHQRQLQEACFAVLIKHGIMRG